MLHTISTEQKKTANHPRFFCHPSTTRALDDYTMTIGYWSLLLITVFSVVFYQLREMQVKIDNLNRSIMQCLPLDMYTEAILTEENYTSENGLDEDDSLQTE